MKKLASLIILLIFAYGCAEYKPIFKSPNLKFKILDFSLEGDKKIGKQIYFKLENLSKTNQNQDDATDVYITFNVTKQKEPTAKDGAGKILEYRININSQVKVKNYLTDKIILNKTFAASTTYKVQNQYSETIKLESKSINNLINYTFQELLIELTKKISE